MPPTLARQLALKITFSSKLPPQTRAEGGQVVGSGNGAWISPFRLIPFVMMAVGHQPDEISPVPSPAFTTSRSPYTEGFFAVAFPGSSPLPWPSLTSKQLGSLLSRFRVAISVLQDSLYVAGCCFASLSQGVTSLQHTRSPRCTGCLLHGLLEVTMTGLAPVSRQWLIRTHYMFSVKILI